MRIKKKKKKNLQEKKCLTINCAGTTQTYLSLIGCISEYFLFRKLLRLDVSSYILLLTTVTTTYKHGGQAEYTKRASKSARFMVVEY